MNGPQIQQPNQFAILKQVAKADEFGKLLDLVAEAQKAEIGARQASDAVRLHVMDLEKKYREKILALTEPPAKPGK